MDESEGFFTVRGLKHGVGEIDLLGVRPSSGTLEAWHVEVQASFRPIGYISPLLAMHVPKFGTSRTSVKKRPHSVIDVCAAAWVEKKYFAPAKVKARDSAWPQLDWQFVFVHAEVRDPRELELIRSASVRVVLLYEVLGALRHQAESLKGGAGTDLAELIEYYNAYLSPRP
jgi:hypothetical protein